MNHHIAAAAATMGSAMAVTAFLFLRFPMAKRTEGKGEKNRRKHCNSKGFTPHIRIIRLSFVSSQRYNTFSPALSASLTPAEYAFNMAVERIDR